MATHHHQRHRNTRLPEGEKLNAIQMAMRVGVEIPYYCWHPALSVVANCRMCEIEVGSKDPKTGEIRMMPKLVPGCQTPAKDGTVLVTDSDKVKEHQRMIMEYAPDQPPARLPRLRPGRRVRPAGLQLHYGQSSPPVRRGTQASTPARTSPTRSSSTRTAASCAPDASGSPARSPRRTSFR